MTLATWLLRHLHPAVFGAGVGSAVTAVVGGADLQLVCVATGIATLSTAAVFGVLPALWLWKERA